MAGSIDGLRREVKASLDPERYRHTLAVERLAAALARRHGVDERAARRAALLHDLARRWSPARLARHARGRRLPVPIPRETPPSVLWHAYVGADLAERRFGERSRAVLRAIACHTLGGDRMGRLERVLYVADLAAGDRVFPDAARVRRLASRDLAAAMKAAVACKLAWAVRQGKSLHPVSVKLWNDLAACG